jgi:hypothetical protein
MFHVAERLMTMSLPAEAVARISQGEFAPARFDEVLTMTRESAVYLKPGIEKLPGMRHYFAAVSPLGSIVHVSLGQRRTSEPDVTAQRNDCFGAQPRRSRRSWIAVAAAQGRRLGASNLRS